MPYKLRKDGAKLLAKWKLKAGKKHYFHVLLWEDQESFDQNTIDNIPHESSGCINLAPTIIKFSDGNEEEIIKPKLGEVHFIKNKWTMEIVAHELCHALIHRIRMILPSANEIMEQDDDSEEIICYEFGRWAEQIYRSLWEVNPYGKHS